MTELDKGIVLLPIARAAICRALGIPETADESAIWLTEPAACFVTLYKHGELRGCIGSLAAHRSLREDVKSNAVSAALRDPRFPPLGVTELCSTQIEISLLTPAEALEFSNETNACTQLRPGIDGVIFEFGRYRSTFLPQVWEQVPEPRLFIAHLKLKAGLPADFWDKNVKLSRYSVTKFSESGKS